MNEPIFSAAESLPQLSPAKKAHVIVLGNEKGGSGKTTTGMHLIVSLLRLGFSVGSVDIDSRQRSLSRYLENRRQTMLKENATLPQSHHIIINRSPLNIVQEAEADDRERFLKALNRVSENNDFVVIDSPGSDTYLARLAHAYADTVITPINDSFVDLDVLATVDGQTMKIIKPSIYSEMMWEQKLARAKRDGGSIEWIVMRNRLSNIDAKNKRFMTQVTTDLSRRIGFRVAPGFSERVIFREMFLQGLTVLDIEEVGKTGLSLSHIAARQEVRDLLRTLKIAKIDERLKKDTSEGDKEETEDNAVASNTTQAVPVVANANSETPVVAVSNAPSMETMNPSAPIVAVTTAPALEVAPQKLAEPALSESAVPAEKTAPVDVSALFSSLVSKGLEGKPLEEKADIEKTDEKPLHVLAS